METCPLASDRRQPGVKLPNNMLDKMQKIATKRRTTMTALFESAVLDWYAKQPESAEIGEMEAPVPPVIGRPPTTPSKGKDKKE